MPDSGLPECHQQAQREEVVLPLQGFVGGQHWTSGAEKMGRAAGEIPSGYRQEPSKGSGYRNRRGAGTGTVTGIPDSEGIGLQGL